MKYVVEVHAPVLETPQALMGKLVEQFNVRKEVAGDLLRLIPGTVTKPVSETEATTISSMLTGVGLRVSTRLVGGEVGAANFGGMHPGIAGSALVRAVPSKKEVVSRQRGNLRAQVLASTILPALLVLAAALGAVLQTVRPALQGQLFEAALNPAVVMASVSERVLGSNDIRSSAALWELDAALEAAKGKLQQQNVSFVMITDESGDQLTGWYGDDSELTRVPDTIRRAVERQSQRAVARAYAGSDEMRAERSNTSSLALEAGGLELEMAAEAIETNGQPVGAVVVGVYNQRVLNTMRSVLTSTLLAGALPVLIAILVGVVLAGALTRHLSFFGSTNDNNQGDIQNVQAKSQ